MTFSSCVVHVCTCVVLISATNGFSLLGHDRLWAFSFAPRSKVNIPRKSPSIKTLTIGMNNVKGIKRRSIIIELL